MKMIRINSRIIVAENRKEEAISRINRRTGNIKGNIKRGDHLSSGVRVVGFNTITIGLEVARGVLVGAHRKVIVKTGAMHSREAEGLKDLEEEAIEAITMSRTGTIRTLMSGKQGLRGTDLTKISIIMTEAWGGAFL